ncbi:MAG: AAA family ATPase [Sphingomonadales bacterium]|nr:AAA family ATPase [Sphingomonadales bacterium]
MGVSEYINFTSEDWVLDLKSRSVLLVLSEAEMTSAQFEDVAIGQAQVLLATMAPDASVDGAQLDAASILILEIRPDMPASLERLRHVRASHPDLPIIAAIRDANVSLVRMLLKQGVRDVVALPLVHSELASIIAEICDDLDAHKAAEVEQGQLVSVLKSIGGVGATTIATHLAGELAARSTGKGVCLIDLDLQFGDAGAYMGLSSQLSIADLVAAGARIDRELLRSVVSKTENGLHVIPAPMDIMPLESVSADQMLRIIELAREEFDHVILDLPTNWTNWTLSLVALSDVVFLVAELSVASLRQAKRQLQLLVSQGISGQKIHVVANRVEKRMFRTINLDDAAHALGHSIEYSIHNDYPLVRAAHDQGVLINAIRARSKIGTDIAEMLPLLSQSASD